MDGRAGACVGWGALLNVRRLQAAGRLTLLTQRHPSHYSSLLTPAAMLPRSHVYAGSLFQSFPLSRMLKASMELAVKGSTLNQWSLIVSRSRMSATAGLLLLAVQAAAGTPNPH